MKETQTQTIISGAMFFRLGGYFEDDTHLQWLRKALEERGVMLIDTEPLPLKPHLNQKPTGTQVSIEAGILEPLEVTELMCPALRARVLGFSWTAEPDPEHSKRIDSVGTKSQEAAR